MPSEYHIAAHTERRCTPCEHLRFENACYGHDFVRGTYVCHHPQANEFGPLSDDPQIAAKQGELRAGIAQYGREISKHRDCRPSWCPLYQRDSGQTTH